MSRETVFTALHALVSAAAGFASASRRLVMWTDLQPAQLPAVFTRDIEEEHAPRHAPNAPPVRMLSAEVWVYASTDPALGNPPLGDLLDAIETALKPLPGMAQTLGGMVQHVWIEGRLNKDPGDIDNVAKAIIPIRILLP